MHRFLMSTGVAILGLFVALQGVRAADGASVAGGRSSLWKQAVALAASDPAQIAEAMKRVSMTTDSDRAAFVNDVLVLVESKPVVDAGALNRDLAAAAGALAAAGDAAGCGKVVLQAIASFVVGTGVTGDTLQVTPALKLMIRTTMSQLPAQDRAAFAADILAQAASHKLGDEGARAVGDIAIALVAGAGSQKADVIAEIFASTPMADLPAVTASLASVFNQHKNGLTSETFLQISTKILDAVATRLTGLAGSKERYAYALSAFISAAANPADFRTALAGAIPVETLGKVGMTKDSMLSEVQAIQPPVDKELAALQALEEGVLTGKDPITTTGQRQNVTVEQGPAATHENRPPNQPPPGYQNQGLIICPCVPVVK